jgi:hypothetical protein
MHLFLPHLSRNASGARIRTAKGRLGRERRRLEIELPFGESESHRLTVRAETDPEGLSVLCDK